MFRIQESFLDNKKSGFSTGVWLLARQLIKDYTAKKCTVISIQALYIAPKEVKLSFCVMFTYISNLSLDFIMSSSKQKYTCSTSIFIVFSFANICVCVCTHYKREVTAKAASMSSH